MTLQTSQLQERIILIPDNILIEWESKSISNENDIMINELTESSDGELVVRIDYFGKEIFYPDLKEIDLHKVTTLSLVNSRDSKKQMNSDILNSLLLQLPNLKSLQLQGLVLDKRANSDIKNLSLQCLIIINVEGLDLLMLSRTTIRTIIINESLYYANYDKRISKYRKVTLDQ
jgi:hypothetical protein